MTAHQPLIDEMYVAKVKQVLSGDTVVLRGLAPKGGPPPIEVTLSNVLAPKLACCPNQNNEEGTKDEPYAFNAREFLRRKLMGKKVFFTLERNFENNRDYGNIYIKKGLALENVAEMLVSKGLVDVLRAGIQSNEAHQRLCELEDLAKAAGKGKHGRNLSEHVREMVWHIENPRNFINRLDYQPVHAIVEHVQDGSTMRVLIIPPGHGIINTKDKDIAVASKTDFFSITLMLSGIRCPAICEETPELFAEEAKFFTERHLLQKDVFIILESVSNNNFLGSIIHPYFNITELLLEHGFARCVDWGLQCVTRGIEKLRIAEKSAKEKRLGLWKDYTPSGLTIDAKEKEFQGKVVEVIDADALMVKVGDGPPKKIFLASIRPPRLPESSQDVTKTRMHPLYEIPYMFEAREFLRTKLIGKKVNVVVDYKQPANNNFLEKFCCTVTIEGINVAEALVSEGLATAVRYRTDDIRSVYYDKLLSAEIKAVKAGKGMHSKKENPVLCDVDLSGVVALASTLKEPVPSTSKQSANVASNAVPAKRPVKTFTAPPKKRMTSQSIMVFQGGVEEEEMNSSDVS